MIAPVATLVLLAGCGGPPAAEVPATGPAPQLVVERFLQAANTGDWATMRQLFGTSQQTIADRDGPERADRHMHLLASLLRHDDFVVSGRQQVPGRTDATYIVVTITRQGEQRAIPFLVVPRAGGGWIIERIERLEELT